jgi:tetratricopeptide (TPR) repeat protein
MSYRLILVDALGSALCAELRIRVLREFPGSPGLSVHFRPIRNDLLFESAKAAGTLAYRVLHGEGIARSQLLVEYEVPDLKLNVRGRSADLLFALALITAKWKKRADRIVAIAATGTLSSDGSVGSVEHTAAKVAAAVRAFEAAGSSSPATIFFPLADVAEVDTWRAGVEIPKHVELRAVAHLDDALGYLGYSLEKVYLRNPFRGLEHFDYADHAVFFGRDVEVRDAVEQLLRREGTGAPGLLVEGASGSGKSSFLRAGVLHTLAEPRFLSKGAQIALGTRCVSLAVGRAIWRPGLLGTHANEAQLAASIAAVWAQLPEFPLGWRDGVESLADLAHRRRQHWPESPRFVWLVDQFEEMLARADLIDVFSRFLQSLQADGVWTLASIRADATPQLKRHETLREVFGANEGQYYLASLSGTALDAVIALPARAADLTFEIDADGVPLDQRLREDAYKEKDGLPALQFTLNELYIKRAGNQLTYAAYRELGGLSGSIATTAQAVLASAGEESHRAAQRVFRSLVSVDDAGVASRRYAPLTDMTGDPAQRRLLERLIEARLCVTDQRAGEAVVAFAHDTLLQTLPPLTEWLKHEAGLLQARELAWRDTRSWQQHGESDDWLASADKLALYQSLETAEIVLPDAVRAFIGRSARRLRRTRRIKRMAVAAIASLAAGVVIGAVAFALQTRKAALASNMAAQRGEFLLDLLKSADPHGGKRDITVAEVLDASAKNLDRSLGNEPLVEASMLGVIAGTNSSLGRYEQGFAASDRQLELLRANGGSDLEVARALIVRGELFRAHGLYAAGLAPLREAISKLNGLFGVDTDKAQALDELAMALINTRQEKEAEAVLRQAIGLAQRTDDKLATIGPMQSLGVLLGNQGRYEEAAETLRRAIALNQQYGSPDDPGTLINLGNYAELLSDMHQPEKAEHILRELVGRSARILGPTHTDTLVAQVHLGDALTDLHRYAEAEGVLRAAAEGLERNEGPRNRYTTGAWSSFTVSACEAGHADAGLEVARRIAEIRKQSLPDGDWHLSATQTNIGLCLVRLKRYAEADPILAEARAQLEATRGPNFYQTQLNYEASQDLYAATGRPDEAAQMASKIKH